MVWYRTRNTSNCLGYLHWPPTILSHCICAQPLRVRLMSSNTRLHYTIGAQPLTGYGNCVPGNQVTQASPGDTIRERGFVDGSQLLDNLNTSRHVNCKSFLGSCSSFARSGQSAGCVQAICGTCISLLAEKASTKPLEDSRGLHDIHTQAIPRHGCNLLYATI